MSAGSEYPEIERGTELPAADPAHSRKRSNFRFPLAMQVTSGWPRSTLRRYKNLIVLSPVVLIAGTKTKAARGPRIFRPGGGICRFFGEEEIQRHRAVRVRSRFFGRGVLGFDDELTGSFEDSV